MDLLSDENLVVSACTQDKAAQAELVKRHYKGVFVKCFGILGSVHDAEDAAQEVMLKAFSQIHKLRKREKFASWLTTMARNTCINYLRRNAHLKKVLQDNAPQINTSTEQFADLHSAIEQLSDDLRFPLVMYYLQSKTAKEISQELEMSTSAVYQKLRTATIKLHELLIRQGVKK